MSVESVYDHPDWAGFIAAIRANPADDTVRLVAADWLEEHDPDRAELIRLGVERRRVVGRVGHRLTFRSKRLAREFPVPAGLTVGNATTLSGPPWGRLSVEAVWWGEPLWQARADERPAPRWAELMDLDLDRGFVTHVWCEAVSWLAHGDAILAREPVERVTLTTWPGHYYFFEPQGHHLWVIPEEWCPDGSGAACLTSERSRVVGNLLTDRWPGVGFALPPPEPVQRWQVTGPDGPDAGPGDWFTRHVRDGVARGMAERIDRQFRAG